VGGGARHGAALAGYTQRHDSHLPTSLAALREDMGDGWGRWLAETAFQAALAEPHNAAFADAVMRRWQWFRAGIEGTISALRRAFRLFRCLFRGFRNFASGVGLSVFGHNLIVLADQAPG